MSVCHPPISKYYLENTPFTDKSKYFAKFYHKHHQHMIYVKGIYLSMSFHYYRCIVMSLTNPFWLFMLLAAAVLVNTL